jgi:protoporphyrinogen oxidase
VIKTLIDSFRYPRKGPGMMWEACAEKVKKLGGQVQMGCRVKECHWDAVAARWKVVYQREDGTQDSIVADHLLSSAPLRELTQALRPLASSAAIQAACSLKYRDFLTVVLMTKGKEAFTDNWIYIHDPGVKVGRVQNFKSWSPEMVPDPSWNCYGMEYFCFEGDGLWTTPDAELIELAKTEFERIGLCKASDVLDGCVVRQPKAYPVYDEHYVANVAAIWKDLHDRFPTLHVAGRNGMHKYNNQDHSMMTAMLSVENILAGRDVYDVWQVNEDAEYHEAGKAGQRSSTSGLRMTPKRVGT